MSEELKLCPFCGGEARKSGETFGNTILSWVYCTSCGAAGGYRHTEAEVIEAWNARAELTCRNMWEIGFLCSECGTVVSGLNSIKYCPNCGRRIER